MRRTLPVPAAEAFALLTDLRGHGRWTPLTVVDAPPVPPRPGDAVTAVTACAFVDRMQVVGVRPPDGGAAGLLEVRKVGPVLLGSVQISVHPRGPTACEARWEEDVWLRGPLPRRWTGMVLTPVLETMSALALWRVERHLTGRTGRTGPPGRRRERD
ncbi:hypothetical protein MF406_03910 [Georgenia sp. TF02-10]|uniref:hypothetical protein n=1 Tax=Georgenia sp. TF02-10 TaxID=2917725 RepID=UPI001FA6D011|nr:hypothetical protein [Georgenia sp. TF02-10]UNX55420.1 hypothetical protein MF406_03910 [Georgenia sp. TF02-10]